MERKNSIPIQFSDQRESDEVNYYSQSVFYQSVYI